jgi:squalene-hopene/tetraprenyl-beta-curcumene cyclase
MGRATRHHPRATRLGLASAIVAAAALAAGCGGRREPPGLSIERSIAAGTRALIGAQAPDGTWRSRTYGALKDGLSLTPTVLKAVVFAPDVEGSTTARRRGAAYLAGRVGPDGAIDAGPFGFTFPVYSAAEAAIVLARVEVAGAGPARRAWLDFLRARQLTGDLGWTPDDLAFGAWGDATSASIKAQPDSPADADLSSTLFAVGALRIAGAGADDPAVVKALGFIVRCQNFTEEDGHDDPAFDDGGFFFSPTDPVRNKAGVAGTDRDGRVRYHSYGSATADGLRALLRCGLSPGHPRVAAARRWLEWNFSPAHNPGSFEPARTEERDATYYYYAWSLAHAFRALGGRMHEGAGRETAWAEMLARELIGRQRADGTWSNRFTASKEDDPLVATPLALGALGLCRAFVPRP